MKKLVVLVHVLFFIACQSQKQTPNTTAAIPNDSMDKTTSFRLDTLQTGLKVPFGMSWLPDGKLLITERKADKDGLGIIDMKTGKKTAICNLPKVINKGQGGMLDVLVHPNYAQNGWIYLSFSGKLTDELNTMVIERAKLKDNCLADRQVIFQATPGHDEHYHYGNRLVIKDGFLYFGMGERYANREMAQTLNNHMGKIIRLHDDGRIPVDNPFSNRTDALREIWSFGHRNPQGLAFRPGTAELWESEHGPQGGDEINLIEAGSNYGWPVITYGEEYGGGKIGQGITEKEGLLQPVYKYVPSIGPGGMDFYSGDAFPAWKGNLFLGGMALTHLNRVVFEGKRVVKEERLLGHLKWRIRCVKQGPDGYLYLTTDEGLLVRMVPK